jgi:hypothetical protein
MRYRLLNASICVMAVVDIFLTGVFVHQRMPGKSNLSATSSAVVNKAADRFIAATGARDYHGGFTLSAVNAALAVASDLAPRTVVSTTRAVTNADVSAAMFLLLRMPDISGGQPWVCPSSNAAKWDYRSGTNAAQDWCNWNATTTGFSVRESYSYENPYPKTQATKSSKP